MLSANPPILIRARALTGFAPLVERHGGDVRALLRRAHIPPGVLETPEATLDLAQLVALLENAADTLKIKDFGLQLAEYQDISVLGPVALIARHSATVGDAMAAIGRHLPYHTPGARLALVSDSRPGLTQMRYELSLTADQPRRQAVELSYAVACKFLRLLSPSPSDGWVIHFRHTEGLSAAHYRKQMGCSVLLGQPFDALVFPTALLAVTVDVGSTELAKIAERFVANVVRRFPLDIARQVETLLRRQLAAGGCTLPRIAGQLGLHARTLQRRLEAQNCIFEELIDRVRRERATEYLPHRAIPLTQVATLLGYSEQSSFNRACQRWFGRSPLVMRDELTRESRDGTARSRRPQREVA